MAIHQVRIQKGRGAQLNVDNPYSSTQLVLEHIEGIDEPIHASAPTTQFFEEHAKKIINSVDSTDIGLAFSMNPYQGCEHGCIYCYARNTHQYWGYSAGVDFESKIIVKRNAAQLLRKQFDSKNWKPHSIMLSGNTDCYQPAERKFKLTRQLLEVCLEYKNPVNIITKNSLILRDTDLLKELALKQLVQVSITVTSLQECIRLALEPRTTTAAQRLRTIEALSKQGIPVHVMVAPIIPGLTDHEVPEILKAVSERGALGAHYTIVRLNGSIGELFTDWVNKHYPDKAEKILNQIASCHGGKLNDSRPRMRMKGEGNIAESIAELFRIMSTKYFKGRILPELDTSLFRRPSDNQLSLF